MTYPTLTPVSAAILIGLREPREFIASRPMNPRTAAQS